MDAILSNFHTINLETIFNLKDYSSDVKKHLINVYFSLLSCLFFTFLGTYLTVTYELYVNSYFTLFGSLGLMLWLQFDQKKYEFSRRFAIFCCFGFLQGLSIAPLINLAILIDPKIVTTAVLGTVTVFACFSAAALTSQKRSFLFLGGIISSAGALLAVLSFSNIFLHSSNIYNLQLYGGLMMFSCYVIFDTQLILEVSHISQILLSFFLVCLFACLLLLTIYFIES